MKNVADDIGTLRASIAELQGELKVLEDAVKFNGPTRMDGELYTVVVTTAERKSVSWKAVAESLASPSAVASASARLTSYSDVTKLTCQAFAKVKAAA